MQNAKWAGPPVLLLHFDLYVLFGCIGGALIIHYERGGPVALAVATAAVLLLAGCGKPAAPESETAAAEPVAVEVATAETRPMETTVVAQGTLSAGQGASARIAAS